MHPFPDDAVWGSDQVIGSPHQVTRLRMLLHQRRTAEMGMTMVLPLSLPLLSGWPFSRTRCASLQGLGTAGYATHFPHFQSTLCDSDCARCSSVS